MIIKEKINGLIFVEQRSFYIYKSEEDRQNSVFTLATSQEELFLANKELAKEKEKNNDNKNQFFVL